MKRRLRTLAVFCILFPYTSAVIRDRVVGHYTRPHHAASPEQPLAELAGEVAVGGSVAAAHAVVGPVIHFKRRIQHG